MARLSIQFIKETTHIQRRQDDDCRRREGSMQKKVIKIGLMLILSNFFFILAGTEPLLAASFTADMVEIHKGESRTWHFEHDQMIGSVDITMLEMAKSPEQPEKPGTIPSAWSEATIAAW